MAVRVKTQLTRDDLVRERACRRGIRDFCEDHGIHTATALPVDVLLRLASRNIMAHRYILVAANRDGCGDGDGQAYGDGYGDGDGEGDDEVSDDRFNDTFVRVGGCGQGDYGFSFDGDGGSSDPYNGYGADDSGGNSLGDGGFF